MLLLADRLSSVAADESQAVFFICLFIILITFHFIKRFVDKFNSFEKFRWRLSII